MMTRSIVHSDDLDQLMQLTKLTTFMTLLLHRTWNVKSMPLYAQFMTCFTWAQIFRWPATHTQRFPKTEPLICSNVQPRGSFSLNNALYTLATDKTELRKLLSNMGKTKGSKSKGSKPTPKPVVPKPSAEELICKLFLSFYVLPQYPCISKLTYCHCISFFSVSSSICILGAIKLWTGYQLSSTSSGHES